MNRRWTIKTKLVFREEEEITYVPRLDHTLNNNAACFNHFIKLSCLEEKILTVNERHNNKVASVIFSFSELHWSLSH